MEVKALSEAEDQLLGVSEEEEDLQVALEGEGEVEGGVVPEVGEGSQYLTVLESLKIKRKQIFSDAAEEEEVPSSEDDNDEEVIGEDDSSDEDDTDEAPTIRPYAALLQSLAVDSIPAAKRRKLGSSARNNTGQHDPDDILSPEPGQDVDQVREDEEGPEIEVGGAFDEDELESNDTSDPFEIHFANPDDDLVLKRMKALSKRQWSTRKIPLSKVGKAVTCIPNDSDGGETSMPASIIGPAELKLKQKLATSLSKQTATFSKLEQSIAPFLFGYNDVFFCERRPANSDQLRRLACLHAVNHIFKTRDRVIKNNARLAKEDSNDDLDLRDQGFTRPKVLMLLATRHSCVRMVDTITSLCQPEQQENRKRFNDAYVQEEESFPTNKPEDFRDLFGGNDDDMFRMGMKFTRKTIKYFSQFYNSDIIMASPLGLRMAIGTEEEKQVDSDFLSSIELVIVDQADALAMQNWEHVEFVFEHLNLQPKEAHGCDFSRVRNWYLDGNAGHFRQTIALAAFNTPNLHTLFYNRSQNWSGKVKITQDYPGAIQELGLKVKQTLSRLESQSYSTEPDARFTYFTTAIIPSLARHIKDSAGTLIFIPSYLDFVRVRNYFSTSAATSSLSFGSISEYTSISDVARARSHFLSGRHSVLLYTERAHHFRRYQLKGVRKVIMYGLPDNPIFYKEIVGGYLSRSTQEGKLEPGEGSVRAIFSKWDILKLERIAGTERVSKMIGEKGDTFDFL